MDVSGITSSASAFNQGIDSRQNFRIYSQATAGLLALEAAPLLLSPSMAAWMASSEPKSISAFEALVARELGFALLLASFLALLFSGELHRLWDDAENVPGASATVSSPCMPQS